VLRPCIVQRGKWQMRLLVNSVHDCGIWQADICCAFERHILEILQSLQIQTSFKSRTHKLKAMVKNHLLRNDLAGPLNHNRLSIILSLKLSIHTNMKLDAFQTLLLSARDRRLSLSRSKILFLRTNRVNPRTHDKTKAPHEAVQTLHNL
jgi:hypothetical protein